MASKTKIMVFHLKELIYTGIFLVLGICFIILLLIMFGPKSKETANNHSKKDTESAQTAKSETLYTPGVYKSTISLDGHTVELTITTETDRIVSITMEPLDDHLATMYPLLQQTFDSIATQICEGKEVTASSDSRYTSSLLLSAIESALEHAK